MPRVIQFNIKYTLVFLTLFSFVREERQWREWVDTHMVHTLSPNIYRTPREALQAFDYMSTVGNFSSFERVMAKYVGAAVMFGLSRRLKKK